jgi:hypothetical protein
MLYRAWAEGWGPKFYWVGAWRRITHCSRLEWQREREAEAAAERGAQRDWPNLESCALTRGNLCVWGGSSVLKL